MSYQVLARKWRPQRFEDVLGQEHVVRTLQNAIERGRVAHAYIFTGPRGVGKTTTARILAKTLNCSNRQGATPCNECTACVEITAGNSLDVLEIDGASNRGIDEIRELREAVKYPPISSEYRIYIIDEVHMLTTPAFNALLKTLEEPPPHVKFILATTDPQKVPQTILSRTQRFDFRRVSVQDIAAHLAIILADEELTHSAGALQLLARKADGSIRDALSLLDQVIAYRTDNIDEQAVSSVLGLVDDKFYRDLLASFGVYDLKAVLGHIEAIFERGYDMQEMAQGLTLYLRDALISLETGKGELTSKGILVEVPAGLQSGDLIALIQISLDCESKLRYARQPRVLLEHQWLKMASLERTVSIKELLGTLGRGEVSSGPANPAPPASQSTAPDGKSDAQEVKQAAEKKPLVMADRNTADEMISPKRSFRRQTQSGPNVDENLPAPPRQEQNDVAVLAKLREQWPDIITAIAARSGATAAILEGAGISALDEGRVALNLRASEAIHLDMVIDKQQMIQDIIAEKVGQQVTLIPTIAETAAGSAAKKTDSESTAAVQQLIETFDGEDY
ncbi:MAG: DNA polymerase III subunit gamma/tau [Candidatus Marinimicrobia bacterium]|nr:DNA polymerase III subunit gamma/tau [Candidatus Neomarinimicrobiota bacterium]